MTLGCFVACAPRNDEDEDRHPRGAAARASRSRMASPSPSLGIGATAMTSAPVASSARRKREEVRGRFGEIAARARGRSSPPARRRNGRRSRARPRPARCASRRAARRASRRVMRGEHAGRERRSPRRRCASSSGARARASIAVARDAARAAAAHGRPPRQATMVDSTPTCVGPPSSDQRRSGRRDRPATCAACVGLTRPERLADGAATGRPSAREQRLRDRMGRHPQRDAVEPGAREVADARSGAPGTHERQRAGPERLGERAARRRRTRRSRSRGVPRSGTWTISGLKRGRPLAA